MCVRVCLCVWLRGRSHCRIRRRRRGRCAACAPRRLGRKGGERGGRERGLLISTRKRLLPLPLQRVRVRVGDLDLMVLLLLLLLLLKARDRLPFTSSFTPSFCFSVSLDVDLCRVLRGSESAQVRVRIRLGRKDFVRRKVAVFGINLDR